MPIKMQTRNVYTQYLLNTLIEMQRVFYNQQKMGPNVLFFP